MDAIIQEIENLLQTNYQKALDQIQKDYRKCSIVRHITWLLIALAYAAAGYGAFLQKIPTRKVIFSIVLITVAAICTSGARYISTNYEGCKFWSVCVILYMSICFLVIIAESDTVKMISGGILCICMILCMICMTAWICDSCDEQPKMPSQEDVMEYVRRVRDGDIQMIHAEPIVRKSQITRNMVTSQEEGTLGTITITPEKCVPFLTSIYLHKEHTSQSISVSVPINTQQDIIRWANLPIPDNAELPYTRITLFPEGMEAYSKDVCIIRSQHAREFVEAFDAIGRIIMLECIRDSLECRPKYLFRFDENNKVKACIRWDIYDYFKKDKNATDGHTAEIIRQYTERLNNLLEDSKSATMNQCVNGKAVAAIAQK